MRNTNKNLSKSHPFPLKILYILVFGLILSFCFLPQTTEAKGASLYLSPSSGTFKVGSTFDVSIFVNTGGESINAVEVNLKFDPKKVQITTPSTGKSFVSVWISQPTFSNIRGTASFRGGVPSPGINTSSALVSTVTFRTISPGDTAISIERSSRVLLDDGKGTDILTSLGKGNYKIIIPPAMGPLVSSSTHPDQNEWSKNNSPCFQWQKESRVTDFSYSIDNDFGGIPDNISEGDETSVCFSDLEDGMWYFHIKAKRGGNWGGVTHYLVQIDTTPPASFYPKFEPLFDSTETTQDPIIYFDTTDVLSGISYYALKVINLKGALEKQETGLFTEVQSPYKLSSLDHGGYEVVIRAYDKAMNWTDGSAKIDVIASGKSVFVTKKGINIWMIFLDWWKITLVLGGLLFFILIIAFFYWRSYKNAHRKRETLKTFKKNTEKEKEKVKGKLKEVK